MKKKIRLFAAAASSLLCLACAGGSPGVAVRENIPSAAPKAAPVPIESSASNENAEAPSADAEKSRIPVRFILKAADAAAPAVPPGVGSWVPGLALSAARRAVLSAAFRDAYSEALARGIQLTGVLGGDLVHAWTPIATPAAKKAAEGADASAGAFVQNWREAGVPSNSWGLKDLAIAAIPIDGSRAFLIRGALLDAYGQGQGLGGANGIAGYGAPLGDEFYFAQGRAQRFEYGLLLAKNDGTVAFLQDSAPSSMGAPETVGAAAAPLSAGIRNAFRSAWSAAVNTGRTASGPDGPVVSVSGSWGSAYIQTFSSASWGIVLPMKDAANAVSRARIADGPFLSAVGGMQGSAFDFSEYGLPISDSFAAEGTTVQIFEKGRMETVP